MCIIGLISPETKYGSTQLFTKIFFILFVCPINELLYGNRVQIITQRISGIFAAVGIINGSGYGRPKVAFDQ